jgi:HrpA-like RNA helicase
MLRVPLEPLCLQIKATLPDLPVEKVLERAITPPEVAVVDRALHLLKARQALDAEGGLTALGKHLSRMPLDPAVGVPPLHPQIM